MKVKYLDNITDIMFMRKTHLIALMISLVIIIGISGCESARSNDPNGSEGITGNQNQTNQNASQPTFDPSQGNDAVRVSYNFAVKNRKVLKGFYCVCGCLSSMHNPQHDDLSQCFVKDISSKGNVVYDEHGSVCQTCQDEALDIKAWMEAGKNRKDIEILYDEKYGSSPGAPKNWFKDL